MAKIWLLLGTLALAAACGPTGTNCNCVATGACYTATATTDACGVGLVCCPIEQTADGG
jgi:hypothetical protein